MTRCFTKEPGHGRVERHRCGRGARHGERRDQMLTLGQLHGKGPDHFLVAKEVRSKLLYVQRNIPLLGLIGPGQRLLEDDARAKESTNGDAYPCYSARSAPMGSAAAALRAGNHAAVRASVMSNTGAATNVFASRA